VNSSLTSLDLISNRFTTHFINSIIDNNIGTEGVIILSEALKSNSSLTSLGLESNSIVA
jgi:hypothetical protein